MIHNILLTAKVVTGLATNHRIASKRSGTLARYVSLAEGRTKMKSKMKSKD